MAELENELEAAHGLSLGEYAVLVELSEAPDQRLRMSELAGHLHLSPSGLTRRLDLLVREGMVVRESCPSDRRAVYAVLTARGRERLEEAAPDHVAAVRRHLIDRLDDEQLVHLAEALEQRPRDLRRTHPLSRLTARQPVRRSAGRCSTSDRRDRPKA